MRAAVLLVAEDVLAHAVRVRGPVHHGAHVVERGPAYYASCGKLSSLQAARAVSMLVGELQVPRLPVDEVRQLGVPVRQLKPGRRRGRYLLIRSTAYKVLSRVVRSLRRDGTVPPEPTRAQPILGPVHAHELTRRGRHPFIRCPDPEHEDRDPSALVNPDGAIYCFGCQRLVGFTEDDAHSGSRDTIRVRLVLDWRADRREKVKRDPRETDPRDHDHGDEDGSGILDLGGDHADLDLDGDQRGVASLGADGAVVDWCFEDSLTLDVAPATSPRGCYADRDCADGRPTLADTAIHVPTPATPERPKIAIRVLEAAPMGHMGDPADPLIHVQRYVEQHKEKYGRAPKKAFMRLGYVIGKRSRRGFRRSLSTTLDLLDIMRRAEGRECSVKAREKHYRMEQTYLSGCEQRNEKADMRELFPDRFVSLHHHHALDYVESSFHAGSYPTRFDPAAARWIGVDLDGLQMQRTTGAKLKRAAEAIERWCESRSELTGRMGFVRTSRDGVQVVVELAATRWTSCGEPSPYETRSLRALHDQLDRVCMESVHAAGATGGKIDRSIRSMGRYVRLPGPRTKDGDLDYAVLIHASP
jgi:hypothetical protein